MENEILIYDIETFPNFHSFCGYDPKRDVWYEYCVYNNKRQLVEYISFLNSLCRRNYVLVGFNNLAYDYPVIHHILNNVSYFSDLPIDQCLKAIYRISQNVINVPYSIIDKKDQMIDQIDLFKIHHFNNQAKRSSLKDIECAMDFPNVQDLPKKYYEKVLPEEIGMIMKYNRNDVLATKWLYDRSIENINLRKQISKEYGIDVINADDPKIGSEIFAKIICDELKISRYDLDKMRTYHKKIVVKDLIFPNIKFETDVFNDVLKTFNSLVIENTKGEFKHETLINDLHLVYGSGGIHSFNKPCIKIADKNNLIIDADITSMYPNIGIRYRKYPRHLSESFCTIYESVFDKRAEAKRNGIKAINEGLKLALNGELNYLSIN